jgi:hypothetical protein
VSRAESTFGASGSVALDSPLVAGYVLNEIGMARDEALQAGDMDGVKLYDELITKMRLAIMLQAEVNLLTDRILQHNQGLRRKLDALVPGGGKRA